MFELLMTAIMSGDKEETLRLLRLLPQELFDEVFRSVDSRGYSLIHYLAKYNDEVALHFLRDKVPAEMFTQSIHGWTPFMMAVYGNARGVVAYFEEENIDHFATVQEREAFYGAPISPGCDETLLLSTRSPIYAGVAAGKLRSVETLLPAFLKIEIFSDKADKWLICFLYMLELAIENKHLHLLPLLAESMKIFSLEERLKWLMNDYGKPLTYALNGSVLEYIENNYSEPAKIITQLFPYDDLELKKRLILSAGQKSCRKTLQGLLTSLSIAEEDRQKIIKDLVTMAIEIYKNIASTGAQFFSELDVLDVVADCCAPDLNNHSDLLPINRIRGLFKALITLTRSDFGSDSQKLYRSLNREITQTSKQVDVFALVIYSTMFEYGVMLQEYAIAMEYLDRIAATLKMAKLQDIYVGIYFPQITLAKLALGFCQGLKVEIPARTKVLLRQTSANKVWQRWMRDEEGFGIQCPASLLSFANPRSLSTADLEKIWDLLESFKKDVDNYIIHDAEMDLSDDLCQSAIFQKMAKRTYADIMMAYNWWCSVEKDLCPEAINIRLDGNQKELKKIRKFLRIKSAMLIFFANVINKLDKLVKKAEASILVTQLVNDSNKIRDLLGEIASALRMPVVKEEVVIAKPPINPLIIWAAEQGDSKTILRLLEVMDKRLLLQFYQENVSTAAYLAELFISTGQLDALKFLINKLATFGREIKDQYLMIIAVEENQREIIKYLGHEQFATPFHAQAYEGKWPAEAGKVRAASMDATGMVPLGYAISGGDKTSVERLQAISADYFVAPETLLLRCLRARQLHLLPLLVPLVGKEELVSILPKILKASHKRFDQPLAVLRPIMAIVGRKQLALVAMREGYADIMIEILRAYIGKDTRVEVACYLLSNIAHEYGEYNALQAICIRNEKIISENPAAKRIAQSSADAANESKRVNMNFKRNDVIARLARLMADDFQGYPAQLNDVLRKFYNNSHDGGMRDLLSNLPMPVATAAINYLAETKCHPPILSLLHTAIVQNRSEFWYLLVTFGGNLLQKCHDKTTEDLSDLIKSRHKQGISKSYLSKELLFAEMHLQNYCKLLNKLAQGEKLSQEEIVLAVNQIKVDEFKLMPLDRYLLLVWDTVSWCIANNADKTDYDSALRLASTTMHAATGVTEDDYLRYAALAFATRDYHQAALYTQSLELAIYKEYNPSEVSIAQLTTIRLSLVLLKALMFEIPAPIARFYLEKWDTLCEKQIIGEGFLPFIMGTHYVVNADTLRDLLTTLSAYRTPERNKSGKIYNDDEDIIINEATILDTNATNNALFALLIEIETTLLGSKPSSKEDKIKNNELLELFYKSANHINALLKKSWDALDIAYQEIKGDDQVKAPGKFLEFFDKVENKICEYTAALEEKSESKSTKKDSAGSKKADKKKYQHETLTVEKAKPTRISGWGIRMTPQQLLELLPPLTHEEIPEQKPKKEAAKSDSKAASKKQTASSRSTPKIIEALATKKAQPQKTKRRNINISDPKKFPALPSLRTIPVAAEKLAEKPIEKPIEKPTSLAIVTEAPVPTTPTLAPSMRDDYRPPAAPFNDIPWDIVDILRFFGAYDFNEFNAYLTGGAVRDALMGRSSQADYDITVHFPPDYLELILLRKFGVENVVRNGKGERKGDRHSWTVTYNGKKIDFSAEEQAQRDFTCNAMYWHPDIAAVNSDGSHTIPGNLVYDPYGGLKDINDKILRPIHQDPEQIVTNQALIFRAIRFKKQLGFEFSKNITRDIKDHREAIADLPKYMDRDLLIAQYKKMLTVFTVAELHKELEALGLLNAMKARKITQEESDQQSGLTITKQLRVLC